MTNHELARAAAEYAVGRIIMFDALRDLDTPGKQECATKHIEKSIADTYADAMAENERLRRQVALVKSCNPPSVFDDFLQEYICPLCSTFHRPDYKPVVSHAENCPHNEANQ